MRSLAAEEITGLEGNLRSTRTILQKLHINFNYLQHTYTTTAVQWMCKSKRFPHTSSFMKPKKKIVMVEIYRLYVSECFLASKGGVPNKNSKQRMPRLHTSTPESCSLPSTESKQVRFLFQVSSQPSLSIIYLQEFISSFNCMYPFIKSTTKDVINIAH
jgi:DNA mismatch repair ATPase MutS